MLRKRPLHVCDADVVCVRACGVAQNIPQITAS